ncbi:hypothetical protein YERSI8AC_110005 [Enterobacterales bacterium 8AC]|nr:hypothetical protein YERSI8AC_110005 [Enterobacterales bacterium 8AC]
MTLTLARNRLAYFLMVAYRFYKLQNVIDTFVTDDSRSTSSFPFDIIQINGPAMFTLYYTGHSFWLFYPDKI